MLEIVDTEPTMKGQTASCSFKPAMLSNGVRTMVPTHIITGTRVVVMTADGSYVEREDARTTLNHTLARTSFGNSSSGVSRAAVMPCACAKRQKASSVLRLPSRP